MSHTVFIRHEAMGVVLYYKAESHCSDNENDYHHDANEIELLLVEMLHEDYAHAHSTKLSGSNSFFTPSPPHPSTLYPRK